MIEIPTKKGKVSIHHGDCLSVLQDLPDESVNCCITSPPYYGLRDYGHDAQIGLEETPDEYVDRLVEVFREVKRVLKSDGTLWLNLGDSYAGSGGQGTKPNIISEKNNSSRGGKPIKKGKLKQKDLIGIPWRVAFALQEDGWYLRQDIIWAKGVSGQKNIWNNAYRAAIREGLDEESASRIADAVDPLHGSVMPESVKDRCTKSHEYIFLLSKSPKYHYDHIAVKEENADPNRKNYATSKRTYSEGNTDQIPGERTVRNDGFAKYANGEIPDGRNRRSVWAIMPKKSIVAEHYAAYPTALVETCIMAGCPEKGVVLDPFGGTGTTGAVAIAMNRDAILIELNSDYVEIIQKRMVEVEKSLHDPLEKWFDFD